MRRFRTDQCGNVLASITSQGHFFQLDPFLASTEETTDLEPPKISAYDTTGNRIEIDIGSLPPAQRAQKRREIEMKRFKTIFIRAQDACRELFVVLPSFLARLEETRALQGAASARANNEWTVGGQESMKRFSQNDDTDPNMHTIMTDCIDRARLAFDRLPTQVKMVVRTIRMMETDLDGTVQALTMDDKSTARILINMHQHAWRALGEIQNIMNAVVL